MLEPLYKGSVYWNYVMGSTVQPTNACLDQSRQPLSSYLSFFLLETCDLVKMQNKGKDYLGGAGRNIIHCSLRIMAN